MKNSKINIEVTLDDQNVPENIEWEADDHPAEGKQNTKAIAISFWDDKTFDALSLQLWTKEMNVEEMKRFYVNQIGAAANTILNSTGDEFMAQEMNMLCEKLAEYLNKQG